MGLFIPYILFVLRFVLHVEGLNSFKTRWITTDKAYTIVLVTSALFFIFIMLDLLFMKKIHIEQQGLDKITYLDPVTGGLNRYSCDLMLEKYDAEEIKPWLGCFVFAIANLSETNVEHGREQGNILIKNFNDILLKAVGNQGIVARNSPNQFLVMMKKCDELCAENFLLEVKKAIDHNNSNMVSLPIKYRYGMSLNCKEDKAVISQLIVLAQQKMNQE